ncbi:GAP family protein [Actinomadura roseirufa]|uniref:GAP family protein n=1 Tax=Actinomadura roseirufa TaxID=2094049 RepID=UPI0010419B8F|nr:GAP family protein [Actinomadura roseirufa]
MGQVIAELLPLTLGVAISPIPIIAAILMLLTPRPREAALGFLAGWLLGIVGLTVLMLVIANVIGMTSVTGEPKTPVSWIILLLGVLVVVMAVRHWMERPEPGTVPPWMRAVDGVTPARSVIWGLLLAVVNPTNVMMFVPAGIAISQGELGIGGQVVAVAVFSLVAACGVAVPVLGYLADPGRMRGPLDELRGWLRDDNATIMFVLLLVIGFVLLGRGIGGLVD